MAGSIIPMPANGAIDWSDFVTQVEKQRTGYMGLSLTNFDNVAEPQIAAGSIIEVGGSVAKFDANENITGWAGIGADNDAYIKLVPAAPAITAEFTTTAPTWDDAKQGYYGVGGFATHRYVGGLYKDAGGNYTKKYYYKIKETSVSGEVLNPKCIKTANIQDGAVTVDKLGALSVTNIKLADNAVSEDKINFVTQGVVTTIGNGDTWCPNAGLYLLVVELANSIKLEVYADGAWRTEADFTTHWTIFTNGNHVRLKNTGGGNRTIYGIKLAA